MRIHSAIVVSIAIFVAGCSSYSESAYNPVNWWDSEETIASLAPEKGYVVIEDGRALIPEITELNVVNTNGGVIVYARGLPPTQGYHTADLVSVSEEKPVNGVLVYDFRVVPPYEQSRVSTPYSREVTVAHFISTAKLRNVREIRVNAETNSRSSRAQ